MTNIKQNAIKYARDIEIDGHKLTDKSFVINAYIDGAKSILSNKVPTHCRFINKKDAEHWGCTTKEWLQIESISKNDVATYDFAWVNKSKLEFKVDIPYFCKQCEDNKVTRKNDICEECYEEDEEV